MAIVFASVTLRNSTLQLTERTFVTATLGVAPVGTTKGMVYVDDRTFPLIQQGVSLNYVAEIWAGEVGRCTAAPLTVIMWDNAGPVTDATVLTLTVTASNYPGIPDPLLWLTSTLFSNWDTTFLPYPAYVENQDEVKLRMGPQVVPYHVTLIQEGSDKKWRARGDYKDVKYNFEIVVRSEGDPGSEDWARKCMGEIQRILELKWNYILAEPFDYLELKNEPKNLYSRGMAGKYAWSLRGTLHGILRGTAGAPNDPLT